MTEEPLDELERRRTELYAWLAGTGDFRPGSVSQTCRRCGSPCPRRASPDDGSLSLPGGEKGAPGPIAAEASAEVGRLAVGAARPLGCGAGMEAAESVIRAEMLKLGGSILEKLLAADPSYLRHAAGPVTISRAWYHCAACRHGLAPRDAGTSERTGSPPAWKARTTATAPDDAACLVALAGVIR